MIGGTLAHVTARARELGDAILFDTAEGLPQAKALAIEKSTPVYTSSVVFKGANDYARIFAGGWTVLHRDAPACRESRA
jgi:malate dehydrogenase